MKAWRKVLVLIPEDRSKPLPLEVYNPKVIRAELAKAAAGNQS